MCYLQLPPAEFYPLVFLFLFIFSILKRVRRGLRRGSQDGQLPLSPSASPLGPPHSSRSGPTRTGPNPSSLSPLPRSPSPTPSHLPSHRQPRAARSTSRPPIPSLSPSPSLARSAPPVSLLRPCLARGSSEALHRTKRRRRSQVHVADLLPWPPPRFKSTPSSSSTTSTLRLLPTGPDHQCATASSVQRAPRCSSCSWPPRRRSPSPRAPGERRRAYSTASSSSRRVDALFGSHGAAAGLSLDVMPCYIPRTCLPP